MKQMFYDLETTGTDHTKHGIHQISGKIIIRGEEKQTFNFKVQPYRGAAIDPEALKVGNITLNDLQLYAPIENVFADLKTILNKYVSAYDSRDKFHLVGFNSRDFDNKFLRAWFVNNGDKYFGSYFWADSIDVLCLASNHLRNERHTMENFKLKTVAAKMGIAVDEEKLHDAMYDIELTEAIYKLICTNEQVVKDLQKNIAAN